MEGFEGCRGWDTGADSYGSRNIQPSQIAQELVTGRGIAPSSSPELCRAVQCQREGDAMGYSCIALAKG